MNRHCVLIAVSCAAIAAAGFARAETYFFEDFDGPNAEIPRVWWGDATGKSQLATEKAFSGTRSALIESGTAYWEIPLSKPLKWDRQDPAGVGNRPLFLSMRVYAVSGGLHTYPGFRMTIVPKHHPASGGSTLLDTLQADVAQRTGQWLLLCVDVGRALQATEAEGRMNADHAVLESVSFLTFNGGKYYLDDLRLSTEPPEGCTPMPPIDLDVDPAACLRPDPRLEGMVLHGAYHAIGSVIGDEELHASTVRDQKRHYLNFVSGFDFRVTASETLLKALEKTLDQAAQYDMPLLPMSYIGDKYGGSEVRTWSDDKLRVEMLKIVRRLKNKTHLFGWYPEEESGPERAAKCLKQKRWIEEEDPQRSVWTTFNAGPAVAAFGPAYSIVVSDYYPIQGPSPNPWAVPQYVAGDVPRFKQPYLLVDQIFSGGCGWTVPTLGQWRLMAYGAMAEGVKGFFHFVYEMPPAYQNGPDQLYGSMVDSYGTPSPIYQEIERHLGPDLFSFGELLRTCHPDNVPAEIRMACGTVETSLEREVPAIALRRLVDAAGGYEILALYSNNPDKIETGTLHLPAAWLRDRIIMDLGAHSRDILHQTPFLVEGESVPVQLDPGDGRFLAIASKSQSVELIRRMQARRFEALRKMVEFDCRWLAQVGVGKPYSASQWSDLQQLCDQKSPSEALQEVLQLEKTNQESIQASSLGPVLRDLDAAREQLTSAADAIAQWTIPKSGQPSPQDVEPGKGYCLVQDKLGQLYVALSDLAYSHAPDALVQPAGELAKLCAQHAEQLKETPGNGVPQEPCGIALETLSPLEERMSALGWTCPPTIMELERKTGP